MRLRFSRRYLPLLLLIIAIAALIGYFGFRFYSRSLSDSNNHIRRWFNEPSSRAGLMTIQNRVACENAPFILPSDGFIGLLWSDPAGPYTVINPHSGIDIFGDGEPGELPVYAAYEGYLSRLPDWFSTVIIRHDDPLQRGRTIWTYYTHMGARDGEESFISAAFPAGTSDEWVEQGTLLGYQGEYAGAGAPVGLHLHFSVVLSDDQDMFLNESRVTNTIDPSPYLGMPLNFDSHPQRPIGCIK